MRCQLPAEAELDALVPLAVAQHPVGDAAVDEQPDAVLLEDARAVRVCSISARVRLSTTTESMPASGSRWESISPAGPPPTMPTVVG